LGITVKEPVHGQLLNRPAGVAERLLPAHEEFISLSFTYDGELIADLKEWLLDARDLTVRKTAGGWNYEYRRWFVERGCWHYIRRQLMLCGYVLDEEDADATAAR
jgi:hypothetical protein